jgi:hypothetical protein
MSVERRASLDRSNRELEGKRSLRHDDEFVQVTGERASTEATSDSDVFEPGVVEGRVLSCGYTRA